MIDDGLFLTTRAIRRQLAAMPYDWYLIRLIQNRTRQALPGKRLWTATQLLARSTIGFLRARNREGYDIYIRPDAWDQNAGYILMDLDRADPNVLHRMRRNGHQPCLVLQTSPGHLQAWVQVSISGLEPCIATAVARLLAREYGGDPASTDGRHMGRLAGFTNQKPALRTDCGAPWVKVVYAGGGTASNANSLVTAAMSLCGSSWLPTDARHPNRRDGLTSTTVGEAAAIYRDCLNRWHIAERFGPPDWSIVDLWVARHLLSQGVQAAEVEAILQLGSPQFPRRHGNANDYLRRTVGRATLPPRWAPV